MSRTEWAHPPHALWPWRANSTQKTPPTRHSRHVPFQKYSLKVLDQQPTNKSALLRRGKSNWGFDKLQAAETDITKYLEIDPTSKPGMLCMALGSQACHCLFPPQTFCMYVLALTIRAWGDLFYR